MKRSLIYVCLACLSAVSAGCGLKGDLYLEEEPPVEETVQEAEQAQAE